MKPKIKIYNTAYNNIRIKINFGKNGESLNYRRGQKQYLRDNTGKDSDEFPYILEDYDLIYDILEINNVNDETVGITDDSIDEFYGFNGEYYGELTKEAVDQWWNYDLPDLRRYSVNKDRHENGWGLNLICFYSVLVEASLYNYYLNNLTKEEINKLTNGYEHTSFYDECQSYLKAKEAKDNDSLEMYKEKVDKYTDEIQKVIDEHEDEIIEKFDGELYDVNDDGEITPYQFGLDCGFLNIYTRDKAISEAKQILYNAGEHDFKWLSLKLPYAPQSVTIKKKIFNEVRDIVRRELGESLMKEVYLD